MVVVKTDPQKLFVKKKHVKFYCQLFGVSFVCLLLTKYLMNQYILNQ